MASPIKIGIDGFERPQAKEKLVNAHVSELFSTPVGKEVLEYLRSITIEMVNGPDLNPNSLIHMEGQRYIVGLIERRIKIGKSYVRR